jgi:magnesium-transporting ATPase (P-type)
MTRPVADTPEPGGPRPNAGPSEPAWRADESWHALAPAEVTERLATGDSGLSTEEAARRYRLYGPNVLPRPRRAGALIIYLRQFKNPLVYLLLAATVVSLLVGELTDAVFIFLVLQFNAAIGTFQEWRAEVSAEALNAFVRQVTIVVRDGVRRAVDAAELVPGDRVQLESGTLVPADLRLINGTELALDESLLTGESTPVGKESDAVLPTATQLAERRNLLLAGTTVLTGRATGVVVAIGAHTQAGRIAEALATGAAEPPPLVHRLERFSRVVGVATMILIALLAAVQVSQGLPLATVFLVAVALAVAAIPEGLPVAITVALAIATNRMARRNVIVRALPAVEGLGACTLIASDKTGTLTCNELTIKRVRLFGRDPPVGPFAIGGEGYAIAGEVSLDGRPAAAQELAALGRLAESGALCNEASVRLTEAGTEHLGDTVDVAFLVLAGKLGLDHEGLRAANPELGLIPYEPQRRYAAHFVRAAAGGPEDGRPGEIIVHVKGAAEAVLPMCAGIDREAVARESERMAGEGYRVLAVARGPTAGGGGVLLGPAALRGLELLGLVGLIDPVRPQAPEAIARCRDAGLKVRMVTGDHRETAFAIANQLGIAQHRDQVITGEALEAAQAEPAALDRLVADARVFARVEPVQKLTIVESYQRTGEVVAVTGDGVNDAPALRAANIGVAMGLGGTDVARGAADLILADDNFASIVAGVEEGRVAYDNVRKLIFLLITTGLGEIVLFLLAIAAGLPIPLFAVQLLWLNLVTNGIQDVALAFEKGEPGILARRPRPPAEPLFDQRMVQQVCLSGIYMGVVAFGLYYWCLLNGLAESEARNLLLLLMVLFENVHALNARSETRSLLKIPLRANPFLILSVIGAQGLHVAAMYLPGIREVLDVEPIAFHNWLPVALIALSLLLVIEIYKKLTSGRARGNGAGPK